MLVGTGDAGDNVRLLARYALCFFISKSFESVDPVFRNVESRSLLLKLSDRQATGPFVLLPYLHEHAVGDNYFFKRRLPELFK